MPNIFKDRTGETNIMNSGGLKAEIIAYRSAVDIDVLFENGSIAYNRKYNSFKNGAILCPAITTIVDGVEVQTKTKLNFHLANKDRIGETVLQIYCNMTATIIDYRTVHDIDIEFENGIKYYNRHYSQFIKGTIKCPLSILIDGNIATLTNINITPHATTIIDVDDIPLIEGKLFSIANTGYVMFSHNGKSQLLHRVITNCPKNMEVDHINSNRLDNRKSNLRVCTKADNLANNAIMSNNKSGYRGVSWVSYKNKWMARLNKDGVIVFQGYFDCKHEAAYAYNMATIAANGDFAWLNIIDNDTQPIKRNIKGITLHFDDGTSSFKECNPSITVKHLP